MFHLCVYTYYELIIQSYCPTVAMTLAGTFLSTYLKVQYPLDTDLNGAVNDILNFYYMIQFAEIVITLINDALNIVCVDLKMYCIS